MKASELWCVWNMETMEVMDVYVERFQAARKMVWYSESPAAPTNGTTAWRNKLMVLQLSTALDRLRMDVGNYD